FLARVPRAPPGKPCKAERQEHERARYLVELVTLPWPGPCEDFFAQLESDARGEKEERRRAHQEQVAAGCGGKFSSVHDVVHTGPGKIPGLNREAIRCQSTGRNAILPRTACAADARAAH